MKLSIYSVAGEVVGDIELDDAVFGVPANIPLMHQAVVQHQANARVGTASTKTRSEVAGTTKKMYKQKGTGRARHGSRKVNLWTGGGVVHGPRPRSYEQQMPKKMRRLAIRSALSVKVRDGQLIAIDSLPLERPRTRDMIGILDKLPVGGRILITLPDADTNVLLSARNIPLVSTLPATALNTQELLKHDYLVATVPALRAVEQWLSPKSGSGDEANGEDASKVATTKAPAPATRRTRAAAAETPTSTSDEQVERPSGRGRKSEASE